MAARAQRGGGVPPSSTAVAVCVATLQRPVGLGALLSSFSALEVPDDVRLRIVIVDNDHEGSARHVVDEWRARIPAEVCYEIEGRRGISYARNTGVRAAGDVDWVAFVDDDEVVTRDWLREMLRVAKEYDADVVTGTVLPRFSEPPPAWVEAGRFFERPRFATGTALPYARTSNAFVAARLLTGSQGPFDERLARSGGEDTHFFQRVRLAGGRMVWADDAVVEETVPVSRIHPRWLLQREYRRGNTLSLCLRDLEWSRGRLAKRIAAAVVHAAAGVATAAAGLARGKATLLRGAQRVAFAGGLLTGLTGRAYQEYEQIHGS